MKEQSIVRISAKKMNVNAFREKYVTLGKEKLKHEKELEAYANKFLEKNYSTRLTVPIKISGRLTSAGGVFRAITIGSVREPLEIHISERFIAGALHDGQEGLEAILDTLKHELVHYALYKLGRDFKDGDHDFENELSKLNIGASGSTSEKLVRSKKLNVWYTALDVYERQSYDLSKNKIVTFKSYKKHAQKEVESTRYTRVAYEVIKSYF